MPLGDWGAVWELIANSLGRSSYAPTTRTTFTEFGTCREDGQTLSYQIIKPRNLEPRPPLPRYRDGVWRSGIACSKGMG